MWLICLDALEQDLSEVSTVETVLRVLDQLLQTGIPVQESSVRSLLHAVECMNNSETTLDLAILVLADVLHAVAMTAALATAVIQQLFNEVYKGAQYPQVVTRAIHLWSDFEQNRCIGGSCSSVASVLHEFDEVAADAYQNAFLLSLNTQTGLESTTRLLCSYIVNEGDIGVCS